MQSVTVAQAQAMAGQDLGVSEWKMIDQARINMFAEVTEDHQFIHVNEAAAKMTPFGGTIAHGFLTLSMLSAMMPEGAIVLEGIKMAVNYGFEKVRFLQPVPSGKRIRARHKLVSVDDKGGGRYLITNEVTVEIEGQDKPALSAVWLGMHFI